MIAPSTIPIWKKVVEPAPEKAPAVDKVKATAEKLADVKVTEAPQKGEPTEAKAADVEKAPVVCNPTTSMS